MNELTDQEAEMALLGAVLSEPDAWDAVSDLWRPTLFSATAHIAVAKAVADLRSRLQPIDPVTVRATLRESGADVQPDFVELVAEHVGEAGNARAYAEHLADLEAKRQLKITARKILADTEGTAAERVDRASRALLQIGAGVGGKVQHIGVVTRRIMLDLEKTLSSGRAAGANETFPTGFNCLDRLIGGFRPGVLVCFVARPSQGKSSLAIALADNIASRGVPVGAFWLEDDALDFGRRALLRRSKISSGHLRQPSHLTNADLERMFQADDELRRLPIYIDDTHGLTAIQIAQRMRRMHREHGVRVFLADHLGEMRVEKGDRWGDRHDLALGLAARTYRDTAKDLGAAPILFAQMNRQVERRADATPRLADIDGSGQVEQVARFVGFLSRQGTDRFRIDVQKNTFGPTLPLELFWLEDSMAVENL